MITPKDMDRFTNNQIVDMYGELNQNLTKTIIRQLRKDGDISSFTRSQIRVLKKTGGEKVFKEALRKTNKLTPKRKKEIQSLFDDIAETEMKGYEPAYKRKGIDYELSDEMVNILDYAVRTGNKDLKNLTGSIAYKTKRTYIKAVDRVYKEVATGAYDYNTSIKRAVRDLAQQGITLENSIGHQEQLDVAVKRALYTGIQRTAKDLAKQVGYDIDANCVVIGHSTKCRPTHHPIDAVTMSLDEFEKYEYLTEEYNCNHIVNYDWQPEFDKANRKVEYHDDRISYEDTLRNYKIQQKANYYARQVRSKKSDIASGDNTKKAKTRLRLAQKKYREFCKQNDMEVDYLQTWKVGYNK